MPSSVIRAFAYRAEARELDIIFVSGRRYRYRDVPPVAFEALRTAFSKGQHFNTHIRDRYDFSELEA